MLEVFLAFRAFAPHWTVIASLRLTVFVSYIAGGLLILG